MASHTDPVRAERERIAQELHDTVGHHLTVLAIHAGALTQGSQMPASVHAAIDVLRRTAALALADLRRVMDDLDAEERAVDASTTGNELNELDGLIDGVAAAGLTVALTLDGTPTQHDRAVSRTAVRIVQEALTNAVKHGRATDGRVALSFQPDSLVVEVVDNGHAGGTPRPVDTSRRPHRGLLGMQRRVAVLSGDLQVGPSAAGGFRVWARLPRLAQAPGMPS
jgi:signal transduction histidine kinase